MEDSIRSGISAGDIVLLRSRGLTSWANRSGQSYQRKRSANFTHIAFADSKTGFIHANKGNGVARIYAEDLCNAYPDGYLALRHPRLKHIADQDFETLTRELAYFTGKDYVNVATFARPRSRFANPLEARETFCSHLVNDILKRVAPDLALATVNPLPVDFEELLENDQWMDVTDDHNWFLRNAGSSDGIRSSEDRREHYYAVARGWDVIYQHTALCREAMETTDRIQKAFGLEPIEPLPHEADLPIDFWDSPGQTNK